MEGSDKRIGGRASVLSVIGAPIEDGVGVPGTIMGPAALRTAGLVQVLRDLGYEIDDHGDLALPEGIPPRCRLPDACAIRRVSPAGPGFCAARPTRR